MQHALIEKLTQSLSPIHLEVRDDSHKHQGHPGVEKAENTHFYIVVVSKHFKNMSRIARQKHIFKILEKEMSTQIHALSMTLFTPEEWKGKS